MFFSLLLRRIVNVSFGVKTSLTLRMEVSQPSHILVQLTFWLMNRY
jgi:hypothetical protein